MISPVPLPRVRFMADIPSAQIYQNRRPPSVDVYRRRYENQEDDPESVQNPPISRIPRVSTRYPRNPVEYGEEEFPRRRSLRKRSRPTSPESVVQSTFSNPFLWFLARCGQFPLLGLCWLWSRKPTLTIFFSCFLVSSWLLSLHLEIWSVFLSFTLIFCLLIASFIETQLPN